MVNTFMAWNVPDQHGRFAAAQQMAPGDGMLPHMSTPGSPVPAHRTELLAQHADAKRRREAAALGSDEFRAASEDVARVEIAIAASEEPTPPQSAPAPDASARAVPRPGRA
jgi:hypothetical protein